MSGLFGGASGGGGIGGNLPTGVKMAAVALLAHQLMKHSQSGQDTASAGMGGVGGLGGLLGGLMGQSGSTSSTGGGLGGGMGGMLGGLLGSGALGGLGGLLGNLRGQGLDRHVDSWVGHGENHPVAPHELERAFQPEELDEAARHAGTDRGTLLNEMSQVLPGMVDRMTPGGQIPQREEELGSGGIGGLLGQLLGGGRR
jgi:uncharacterized protein YidB (DUF937 family)